MSDTIIAKLFIVVGEDGEFAVNHDRDNAISDLYADGARVVYELNVKVAKPADVVGDLDASHLAPIAELPALD